MGKNNISREIIEDGIMQLICLAEVNLECCKVIYKSFKEKEKRSTTRFFNKNEVRYLMLSALNHFYESISIVHSLLHQTKKKKKELSFELYEEEIIYKNCFKEELKIQEFLSSIEDIRKEYKKEKFPKIRDKIVAHKEQKYIGNPLMPALNFVSDEYIKKLQELVKNLKESAFKFFKAQISYNLSIDYKEGLKNLLDSF